MPNVPNQMMNRMQVTQGTLDQPLITALDFSVCGAVQCFPSLILDTHCPAHLHLVLSLLSHSYYSSVRVLLMSWLVWLGVLGTGWTLQLQARGPPWPGVGNTSVMCLCTLWLSVCLLLWLSMCLLYCLTGMNQFNSMPMQNVQISQAPMAARAASPMSHAQQINMSSVPPVSISHTCSSNHHIFFMSFLWPLLHMYLTVLLHDFEVSIKFQLEVLWVARYRASMVGTCLSGTSHWCSIRLGSVEF